MGISVGIGVLQVWKKVHGDQCWCRCVAGEGDGASERAVGTGEEGNIYM